MITFILKLWYVACAIFCLYNLNTLVSERCEVAILAGDQSKSDPITFWTCKELNSIQLNKTEISLEELRNEMIESLKRISYDSDYEIDLDSIKNSVFDRLKTGQYLIFNDLFCIPLNENENRFFMMLALFQPAFFAFRNSTLDFTQISSLDHSFSQLIVQMKGPPYSNCSESNSRFRCLNECFKKKFRLSRYFYEGNETGLIHLSLSTNRTIEESEKNCFGECWRENCEIVQLTPFCWLEFEIKDTEITRLEARPKLSEFDYWVQFIGLVCSFANISLNQLASMTIQFACSKVKRRRVRIGLFCVKWAILFLSLTYSGYLYTTMILDYKADQRAPPRKEVTRNHIKQKAVRLAICVNTEEYLVDEEDLLDLNELEMTMLEIEKATDGALDDHLAGLYLNYQGRRFRVDYILERKAVLFFRKMDDLYRCFPLLIFPDYQLMPSNPKLTIKSKRDNRNLRFYLLTENEILNEKTFEYTRRAFMKRVVRRLEGGGCMNNLKRYGNCTSRRHCVERCINRGALKKFKKIPIEKAVVDKNQFSPKEWSTTYTMEISSGKKRRIYKNLSRECGKKFREEKLCVEITFKAMFEALEIIPPDWYTIEIDLFLDVELSIEEISWFNLLLNIMSTHSSYFSMNVLTLLTMIYDFIKLKLRIRNDKIAQFLIYLICTIGFTYHTYRILDLTINEELTYDPNYEILNRVRMPVMVFCLPVEEKLIDRNHQLTGNYLEQITNRMTAKKVFQSILYLDESNEWVTFNLSLLERFYFLHLKCFRITIDREYGRRQFHFSENIQVAKVLKVNFTKKFWNKKRKKTIFFMTKTNETEFSHVVNLIHDFKYATSGHYSAEQSELTVKYEDHLSLIKRFLSTSYEDIFNDFEGHLPKLNSSEHSLRALRIPVEKEDFDFELQDDLFEQLFIQVKTNHLDYQQTFVLNHLKEVDYSDSDLAFSLSLIKRTQSAKNEAKLILGLLNVLFWFDLGILDLHPIFVYFYAYLLVWLPTYLLQKITQFLLFCHRWLKKFEEPLYKRLDSRKQIPRQTPQV